MSNSKLIVFVPSTAMGHLRSTVELAKFLVQKDQHISILVLLCHTPIFNSSAVEPYIESQSHEIDSNHITFHFLPPLTNPPDHTSPNAFNTTIDLQKPLIKKALEDQASKVSALVLDMLHVNIMDVAYELDIPSYIYFTSGANLLSLLFHVQSLVHFEEVVDVAFTNDPDAKLHVPGYMNQVPAKVLPWFGADKEGRWLEFILHMTKRFRESQGILVNTFMELESSVIRAMHDDGCVKGKIPAIYPVGPIISLQDDQDHLIIMQWLDAQPPSSVVFLCFGSMGKFDIDQVKEMANGLDSSGYRFLWSLPRRGLAEGDYDEALLPEGFVERMGHRGKVIGWAPQVLVLAHRAIGGFVTHCGWNSILESLWFGVPMATWPIYSEQQLNAFAMVNELGLAIEISIEYRRNFRMEEANILVTAEEIKNGVEKLMNIDEEMKERLREMKDLSRKALKDNGSSNQWLNHFIEVLSSNVREKC